MVRVVNQNSVVCEIMLVLEDNGVQFSALDEVFAKVKEEVLAMPVRISAPGLPIEESEKRAGAIMDECRRRKFARQHLTSRKEGYHASSYKAGR